MTWQTGGKERRGTRQPGHRTLVRLAALLATIALVKGCGDGHAPTGPPPPDDGALRRGAGERAAGVLCLHVGAGTVAGGPLLCRARGNGTLSAGRVLLPGGKRAMVVLCRGRSEENRPRREHCVPFVALAGGARRGKVTSLTARAGIAFKRGRTRRRPRNPGDRVEGRRPGRAEDHRGHPDRSGEGRQVRERTATRGRGERPRRVRKGYGAGRPRDGAGQHSTLQPVRRRSGLQAVADGHRVPAGLRSGGLPKAATRRDVAGVFLRPVGDGRRPLLDVIEHTGRYRTRVDFGRVDGLAGDPSAFVAWIRRSGTSARGSAFPSGTPSHPRGPG